MEFRPAGAGERPLLLVAEDELLAGMADVQRHAWRLVPPVIDALEEVIEEPPLELAPVAAVEERPVRVAVRLQPLLNRGRLHEPVEVASRMRSEERRVGKECRERVRTVE